MSVAAAALFVAAQQTTRPCGCPAPDRRAGGTPKTLTPTRGFWGAERALARSINICRGKQLCLYCCLVNYCSLRVLCRILLPNRLFRRCPRIR
ncbi:hypothetical protein EMIT0158MI4_110210 [Burkholderia ambifaria]